MEDTQRIDAFRESWRDTERYFAMNIIIFGYDYLRSIYELIFYCRYSGSLPYQDELRAGQSLQGFMLSRAVEYGLEPGQPFLNFLADQSGALTIIYNDGENERTETVDHLVIRGDSPEDFKGMHPTVKELLDALAAQPLN
ncbi:MAG: hypothetical protein AAF125_17860 [Chloroflexota bacterium]